MQKFMRANKKAKVTFEEHKEVIESRDNIQSRMLRSVSSSSIIILPKKAVDLTKRRRGVLIADLTENQ